MTSEDSDISFSKSVLPELPPEYRESGLGDPRGGRRQFRTDEGMHAREYDDRFLIHKDHFHPGKNPIGHLVRDSPESLAALGISLYFNRRGQRKSLNRGTRSGPVKVSQPSLFSLVLMFLSFNSILRRIKHIIF